MLALDESPADGSQRESAKKRKNHRAANELATLRSLMAIVGYGTIKGLLAIPQKKDREDDDGEES